MQRFLSLGWYDQAIEFLFRFVAKTSEPLLAAGLTISAADYLSHGAVMAGHPAFSLAWSWCQAVALESSSGVVFVYALSSFRQHDKVKAWLYLALAVLLAITGGAMLLLQINATTMGSAEVALLPLNIMRVVVSIAYIFLLRAKHIRFSDLADTREQQAQAQAINPEVINLLVQKLDHLSVTVTQLTSPALPAIAEHAENREQIDDPIYPAQFASKEAEIASILQERPGATPEEIAQEAGCTVRTAAKWIERLK